jgi:hypothetical protein
MIKRPDSNGWWYAVGEGGNCKKSHDEDDEVVQMTELIRSKKMI